MLVRGLSRGLKSILAAVFAPRRFVQIQQTTISTSLIRALPQVSWVLTVWGLNVIAYAITLNLAGIGLTTNQQSPPWFSNLINPLVGSADTLWRWVVGTVQNSVFLVAATALVFMIFHTCVALADWSRREQYLESLFTVAYTSSVYLAMMFTVITWLSTTSRVQTAAQFVTGVQSEFFGLTLALIGQRYRNVFAGAGSLDLTGVTPLGESAIAVLTLLTLYFLYSMYLGARINHGLDRRQSSFVVVGIIASPVFFIWGSVLFTILLESDRIQLAAQLVQLIG